MAQATLDAFMTKPKDPLDADAAMEVEGKHEDAPTAPKGVPRLRVAGTSTVAFFRSLLRSFLLFPAVGTPKNRFERLESCAMDSRNHAHTHPPLLPDTGAIG